MLSLARLHPFCLHPHLPTPALSVQTLPCLSTVCPDRGDTQSIVEYECTGLVVLVLGLLLVAVCVCMLWRQTLPDIPHRAGINSTQPSPLPPPSPPSPGAPPPCRGLERSGVSDGVELCSQCWCSQSGGGVGGYWWSLLADRSCNTSVVWWYRHWSYEQLQLSSQTLSQHSDGGEHLQHRHHTHKHHHPPLLDTDTARSSPRADTSKWDCRSVLVDLSLWERLGPVDLLVFKLSDWVRQSSVDLLPPQPQLHCDSD